MRTIAERADTVADLVGAALDDLHDHRRAHRGAPASPTSAAVGLHLAVALAALAPLVTGQPRAFRAPIGSDRPLVDLVAAARDAMGPVPAEDEEIPLFWVDVHLKLLEAHQLLRAAPLAPTEPAP